jgi:hypothetical protein
MNQRVAAITTGISLTIMAVIGGYALGFALPSFYPLEEFASYSEKMKDAIVLYKNMLSCIAIVIVLDLIVPYTTFVFFKDVDRKKASMSAIIRVIYTILFGLATLYLTKNLSYTYLTDSQIQYNFELFYKVWHLGLVLFGVHVFLLGILMKAHGNIPLYVSYTTLVAGVCYTVLHLLKLPSLSQPLAVFLEPFLVLPMALGELSLAFWLLFKGGKVMQNPVIA